MVPRIPGCSAWKDANIGGVPIPSSSDEAPYPELTGQFVMRSNHWTHPNDIPLATALQDLGPWDLPANTLVEPQDHPLMVGGWPALARFLPHAVEICAATIMPDGHEGRLHTAFVKPPDTVDQRGLVSGRLALLRRPSTLTFERISTDVLGQIGILIRQALDPIGRELWLCAGSLVEALPLPANFEVLDPPLLSWSQDGYIQVKVRPREDLLRSGPGLIQTLNITWPPDLRYAMQNAGAFEPDGGWDKLSPVANLEVIVAPGSQHERLHRIDMACTRLKELGVLVPEVLWIS